MLTARRKTFVAGALGAPLIMALVAAPVAQAYPPGNKPEVFVKKFKVKPGSAIKSRAVNIKPGCKVTFTYRGPIGRSSRISFDATLASGATKRNTFNKTIVRRANKNGVANATLRKGPRKPGKYKVIIRSGGNGCPPARATTTFKVAKKTPAKG